MSASLPPYWERVIPTTGYAEVAPAVVLVLIALVSARLHEVFPPLLKLRPALVVSTLGVALVWLRSKPSVRRAVLRDPTMRRTLAYFAWCAITIPFALWVGLAFKQLATWTTAILLVYAVVMCPPRRAVFERLILGFTLACIALAIALLAVGQVGSDGRKWVGESYDSNDIAAVLAVSMPFAVGLGMRSSGILRWVSFFGALLSAFGVTATGSRGGALALISASLMFALGFRARRMLGVLVLLVLLGGVAYRFGPPEFRARFSAFLEGEEDYNTTDYGGRKAIWQRGRLYAAQHPLFGVGAANFTVAEGRYLTQLGKRGKWSAPHNAYIQTAAELGIPGLALFVALIVSGALRAARYWRTKGPERRSRPHYPELLSGLVAFATGAIFLSHAYSYTLFTVLALIAHADRTFRVEGRAAATQARPQPLP